MLTMDHGTVDSPVTLVIKAPNQKYDDQTINCFLNWTVEKLKKHISKVYPSKPSSKDQRLVYSGRLLQDHLQLRDVLRKENPSNSDGLRHRGDPNTNTWPQSCPSWCDAEECLFPCKVVPLLASPPTLCTCRCKCFGGSRCMPGIITCNTMAASRASSSAPFPTPSAGPATQPARPNEPAAPMGPNPAPEDRPANPNIQMNAQGGAMLNDDELNRDWLDWMYTVSRAAILLSIVYFYSSFGRFIVVIGAMLLERMMDEGMEDDEGDSGEEGPEDPMNADPHQPGFLSAAWSFISTFFTSLIPEGPPHAAN
ncbi:Homocysteine-responsive endoplasmic reticulum-resident ubiquitin-like domain member 2 protein [Labeo rohita]|uniref:Homocysteine-responsive endoplasmic reticulum-resident ubiquitin-like domain member 2 protein n=1 Tax=Labeo rohita TaxID=84645 RepID=A0ABQ8LWI6_LABRO|nr:Homocysteine-responsive endoplasmic reticulum-resident ubiquitin-like domain member 2 protein [Labeo rohita]